MGRELPASGEVRYVLAPIALLTGEALLISGVLALSHNAAGLRWAAVWTSVGLAGLGLQAAAIGLWMRRPWAAYLLALTSVTIVGGALVVASGVVLRSLRLGLGGPMLPIVVAVIAGLVAVAALRFVTLARNAPLPPKPALGPSTAGMLLGVARFAAVLVLTATVLAITGWTALHFVAGGSIRSLIASPLPDDGEPPRAGVDYRADLPGCLGQFTIGGAVWEFMGGSLPPPPWWGEGFSPQPMPGILRFSSPLEGVFISDVDGSELHVRFLRHGQQTLFCI